MTDIASLEAEVSQAIAAASDEAALEAVRVAALGKSGTMYRSFTAFCQAQSAVNYARRFGAEAAKAKR